MNAVELSMKEKIANLDFAIKSGEQIDIETEHKFAKGVYIRTITVPQGAVITGKIHKTEHIFILSKGEMALADNDKQSIIKAPFQCVSQPGVRRAGLAISDCVVTNVFITNETNIEALELILAEPELLESTKQLGV